VNLAVLLTLTLNGYFAYRLARALGASQGAALSGGMFLIACPLVALEGSALHAFALYGPLAVLESLVRFSRRPRGWADTKAREIGRFAEALQLAYDDADVQVFRIPSPASGCNAAPLLQDLKHVRRKWGADAL
jgi:hypothetical protein